MSYIGISPNKNIKAFTSTRPITSYSKEALNEIKLLSFGKDKAVPFGSAIYKLQAYPGDLDLVEVYKDCCTVDDVITKFEKSMKRIVSKIINSRVHYFSEIKAGLDLRYDINIGYIINGIYVPHSNLLYISGEYYNQNLLSLEEYNIIKGILNSGNTFGGNEYDSIFNIFREHRVLRWTSTEILNGFKKLPGNKKISLFNSLKMNTPVKIDEIVLLNGKFTEITNFIALALEKNNELIPINIDLEKEHNINVQLPQEIEKLYFSNYYYSPFKMIKRIYSLSRHNNDNATLEKIVPFVSSNTSLLYQIKSEIDTITLLFEKVKNLAYVSIDKQLDNMKNRLANVIQLKEMTLVNMQELIDVINNTSLRKNKILLLKELSKNIKEVINFLTIKYLQTINFNPPPFNLLPDVIKYKRITRSPYDNPKNPLKEYDKIFN